MLAQKRGKRRGGGHGGQPSLEPCNLRNSRHIREGQAAFVGSVCRTSYRRRYQHQKEIGHGEGGGINEGGTRTPTFSRSFGRK